MSQLSLPVLRQPHGLTWVGVVQKMDRRLKRETLQLHLEPFPQQLPHRRSPFAGIHAAWQTLAHAGRNTATLRALLTVLRQTYGPPALAGRPLPALSHARDIRPWLNDPACVRKLLLELAPWWGEAVARETAPPPPPTAELVVDPLLHYHANLTVDLEDSRQTVLYAPLLMLALPSGTSARQSAALLQCLARTPLDLTSRQTALHLWACRHGAGWQLAAQLAHPEHSITDFLELSHTCNLLNQPCPPGMDHLLQYLKHTNTPDWKQPLTLLAQGLEPRTIVGWLRLRAAGLPVPAPEPDLPCQPLYRPMRKLLRFFQATTLRKQEARELPIITVRLWKAAQRLEGFGQVLSCIRPAWWSQHHLSQLLFRLVGIWYFRQLHPGLLARRWSLLRPALPGLIRTLEQTPKEMREKALEVCSNLLITWGMQITPELVAVTPALLRTLTSPPFSSDTHIAGPLGRLFRRLPPSRLQEIAANHPLLLHLERASRSSAYRWWVEEGCITLEDAASALYLPLLQHCPGRFVTFLHALGTLPKHARNEVWQMFQEHPLVSCSPATLALDRLIPLLDAMADGGENPVPEKLRAHHAGSLTLPVHVLAHYRHEAWVQTVKMQTRVLLDLAARCQRRSFPAVRNAPAVDDHSLLMARSIVTRRRTLNRVVRMVADQPAATLHHHPANARWLQTLPPRVREHWQDGFEIERTLTKEGAVRLALEQNLQEKLKLGTYAKSCLSPGAIWDESAVAVTLDANKQVLYARNSDRKVVGRQLVALSNDLKLVCFEVYPASCSAEIKSLFATYDLALAQYLGLPLHRSGEYEIAELHGLSWYDDDAMLKFA